MDGFSYKFGFVGMGNMGYAILKGLLAAYQPEEITFYEKSGERAEDVSAKTGVLPAKDICDCVKQAEYVILAIKPQQFAEALTIIKEGISSKQILISIAPGITIADLKETLGADRRIVRAMPNTPALVGEGMTGVCYEADRFSEEETGTIRSFFESFGRMELVEEKLMNAVVCASGSSPAYVYLFIEALADSVVQYGVPRGMAYEMVAQTVLGSAKMVLETGEHPGKLKDQVCSPGGTTIAGVAALEEHGFRNAVIKASNACYDKCNRIS